MRNCRIILDVPAVDAYLYGGYLFLFKADGTLGYIRFERLLGLSVNDVKDDFNDMKMIFLPYQTLKGGSYDFMIDYPNVKNALIQEMNRISEKNEWTLELSDIDSSFHAFTHFDDMPLDVSIYGGEIFMGNSDGLFSSKLRADKSYKLNPEHFKKMFDGEAIHLSSKCGCVAVSSAQNGLFSYDLFSGEYVSDRPVYDAYSLRSDWAVGDSLINYQSNDFCSLLINKIGRTDLDFDVPKGFKDDNLLKKYVEKFGEKKIPMDQLFIKNRNLESNINYIFSSTNSGFFLTKDGEFEVRNLQNKYDEVYYSSKKIFSKAIGEILKNEDPISGKTFPGGCVIELYDKVLLLYKDEVEILADEPVFSVRTYLNSKNYRNLITIVYDNRVEIIAIPMLPEKGMGGSSYRAESPIDENLFQGNDFPVAPEMVSMPVSEDEVEDLPF